MSRHVNIRLWSLAIFVAGLVVAGAATLQSVTAETLSTASPQDDGTAALAASLQSYLADLDGNVSQPAKSAASMDGLLAAAGSLVPNDSIHAPAIESLQSYLADLEGRNGQAARDAAESATKRQLAQLDTNDQLLTPNAPSQNAGGQAPSDAAAGQTNCPSGAAPSSDDLLAGGGAGQGTTGCPPSGGGDNLLNAGGGSEDLLAPSPSGTGSGSSEDLLAPAESGDQLLTPGGGGTAGGGDLLAPSGGTAGGENLLTPAEGTGETAEGPKKEEAAPAAAETAANAEHEKLFLENKYPSANTCATCHPKQYEQWSVSQHAYAQLSPVFMAMQIAINVKTSATNGDFCIRCHTPIGMNINESLYISNLKRNPSSREGITCVACHRVSKAYGKISGRFALEQGDIYSPVYGPTGDKELKRVLSLPEQYRVSTSKDNPGRAIHTDVVQFFELTKPGFCGTCHDVTLLNGFRLEEAFAEFQQTPAAKRGVSCQDCHMGKVQGVAAGYDFGPAAMVGGEPTRDRKLTDHSFSGPDYSIIHPGLFPHNVDAAKLKTLDEWLQFDYKAGWGTDAFENSVPKDYKFPDAWKSVDDRYDARDILKTQFERLAKAKERRLQVLRNGFKLSDINVEESDRRALRFSLDVMNGTDGHAVPTGFDAERLLFLQVTVTDSHGNVVYVSGDRDPNGDVRDQHSLYVHNGELPLDKDLFNLQSKFIVRLLRGGEREQVLAVNQSTDVLPFVRPETRATTLFGRPNGARKHKQTIEPGGKRTAHYSVPADKLRSGETYKIEVKMISQMVPVNLIAAIQVAGFDYQMSPAEVARQIVAGSVVLWTRKATVRIE
jgi:Cytochrome c554 and c-prime